MQKNKLDLSQHIGNTAVFKIKKITLDNHLIDTCKGLRTFKKGNFF
jgi:hypothetical protein